MRFGSNYAANNLMAVPLLPQRLSLRDHHWKPLLQFTQALAQYKIGRRKWRGAYGGVLPEGLDSDSIAADGLADLFSASASAPLTVRPSPVPATPPELQHESPAPLVSDDLDDEEQVTAPLPPLPSDLNPILPLLHRLLRLEIDRLQHRKENRILRNEPDLARVYTEDHEAISPWDTLSAPGPTPLEVLLQKEADSEFLRLQSDFVRSLRSNRRLQALFKHLCRGTITNHALSRKLRLPMPTVRRERRRLRCSFQEFLRQRSTVPALSANTAFPLFIESFRVGYEQNFSAKILPGYSPHYQSLTRAPKKICSAKRSFSNSRL